MSEPLHVATRRQTVDVYFGPGEVTSGAVFLHAAASGHAGEETVLDILNGPQPFFPLRVEAPNARTLLVAKAQVRYLRVPRRGSMYPSRDLARESRDLGRDAARDAREGDELGVPLLLEVQCDDGEVLQGRASIALPPGRQRTLDFVNASDTGFFVISERDHDLLVNRSHVRHVCDVSDTPSRDQE